MNKDLPVGGGVVRSPEKAGRLPGAGRGGCDENREHAYRWSWPVASHGDRGGRL